MPLTKHDAEQLLEQLYATAEVLGSEIKPAAASLMVRDLRDHNRPEIEQALARCRSELTGRLTLAAILERMPSANAHLSANEAWAKALEAQDENATVIWTDEISKALGVAQPILDIGDKVGARMAFIAAYDKELAASKAEGRGIRWWPSLGDSKVQRQEAIEQAVSDGRLESPKVEHLLPAPEGPCEAMSDERFQEAIGNLRSLLDGKLERDESERKARQEREKARREELIDQADTLAREARHA